MNSKHSDFFSKTNTMLNKWSNTWFLQPSRVHNQK